MDVEETRAAAAAAKRNRVETAVRETVHGLSVQQRTAVIEYLCGASKTKACEVAGYSNPNKQATRVFDNEKVQAVIDEYFHRNEMTAALWVQRMSEQATAVYANYFYVLNEELCIDYEGMLADGYGHLIKEVRYQGRDGEVQVVEFQPTFDSQMAIAKYLGLLTDKQEISGPGGEPVRIIEVMAPAGEGD